MEPPLHTSVQRDGWDAAAMHCRADLEAQPGAAHDRLLEMARPSPG